MAGPFADKEIVLGVTGSIAAYKACELASRLVEAGARVHPVLTAAAQQLVGAASFEALTGQRAITAMFAPLQNPDIEHIALARRADLFLVAPATADFLAKAAHGLADDWLSTALLATRAPVLFAPAMNARMYDHPATEANLALLRARGAHFAGPAHGALACGEVGLGRLADTGVILEAAAGLLSGKRDFAGKHVLITSGPTREPIDPVRYISNRSSGKMGRALALEALRRGARVTVVSGPARIPPPEGAEVIGVRTAQQMYAAVAERLPGADVFIAAAAVADYRVEQAAEEKHKRNGEPLLLRLVANPDIAAYAGQHQRPDQVTVGFAAETHDLMAFAEKKLRAKKLDLIVANQVGGPECAFGSDHVRAALLTSDAPAQSPALIPKDELTGRIFDAIAALLSARRPA